MKDGQKPSNVTEALEEARRVNVTFSVAESIIPEQWVVTSRSNPPNPRKRAADFTHNKVNTATLIEVLEKFGFALNHVHVSAQNGTNHHITFFWQREGTNQPRTFGDLEFAAHLMAKLSNDWCGLQMYVDEGAVGFFCKPLSS